MSEPEESKLGKCKRNKLFLFFFPAFLPSGDGSCTGSQEKQEETINIINYNMGPVFFVMDEGHVGVYT